MILKIIGKLIFTTRWSRRSSSVDLCFLSYLSWGSTKSTKWCVSRETFDQTAHALCLIRVFDGCPRRSQLPSAFHRDSDGSDQTVRMHMLIWVFAVCTGHFVVTWLLSCHFEINKTKFVFKHSQNYILPVFRPCQNHGSQWWGEEPAVWEGTEVRQGRKREPGFEILPQMSGWSQGRV